MNGLPALIVLPYLAWLFWALLNYGLPVSYIWRSIGQRWTGTLTTLGATAIVVLVSIVLGSMAEGVARAYVRSGREDQVVVLRQNARVEILSVIRRDQARILEQSPLIARDAQGPLVTSDFLVTKQLLNSAGGGHGSVSVRGTRPAGIRMRGQVALVQGRWFRAGLGELAVPAAMLGRYAGLGLGRSLAMAGRDWRIVGVFDGGGCLFDSEIWTDADDLMQAFHRDGDASSVLVRLRTRADAPAFLAELRRDPRLRLEGKPEPALYAELGDAGRPMQILGDLITTVLGVGAVLAAMNAMYATVASRIAEIGTLRALGCRRRVVLATFQWEGILVTFLGGLLGCGLALLCNGIPTGTVNLRTWSDLGYVISVTPELLLRGLAFSLLMGMLGGLPPAWRASRTPIREAMRS